MDGSRPSPAARELIPAAVLIVAAGLFAVVSTLLQLTTWTGPGQSMFSDVDYRGSRRVQIDITTIDHRGRAIAPPEIHASLLADQGVAPNHDALESAASRLLALSWAPNADGVLESGSGPMARRVTIRLVTIHVRGDRLVSQPILEAEAVR